MLPDRGEAELAAGARHRRPPRDVLILYEYELTTGERYRNTEVSTVREGQLVETEVFFGGAVNV